jgi:ribosomal protein S18 acetylase RimI-like enzyme
MKTAWKYDQKDISWDELSKLYWIAPLGEKSPKDLETAFTNSRYKCFIFEDAILIGVGRALADGVDCSYICDVAVHPKFQGLGFGKQIIQKLVNLSKEHKKIILYANPGKEGFYSKLGFKKMNTAMAIFKDEKHALDVGLVSEK